MLKRKFEAPSCKIMKNLLNGILLLNKIKNCKSYDIVLELRKILNQKSVVCAESLSSTTEGLLIVMLGQVEKITSHILNYNKRYSLKITLKSKADKSIQKISRQEEIKKSINSCIGTFNMKIPIFYKTQKENSIETERPQKEMHFFDLNIKKIEENEIDLELSCSKGSYIQSWVSFLGKHLGLEVQLIHLKQTQLEPFSIEDSITMDKFKEIISSVNLDDGNAGFKKAFGSSFISSHEALPHLPLIELTQRDSRYISRGRIPPFIIQDTLEIQKEANKTKSNKMMKVVREDHLISLLQFRPFQKLRIFKNFSSQDKRVKL